VTATTESYPAHRLKRDDDRRHQPAWQHFLNLPCQPVTSGFGILDSVDVILQDDLLCRMIKAHRSQPASIGHGPGANPPVNLVMAQQKALQMLPRLGQHLPGRRASPHQVAHRFVRGIGDPDRG
jgi:hypothetical protein